MPMYEDENAPCPKCGKPLTFVGSVFQCHYCFEVNEVWTKTKEGDSEIWTHIKSPVGLIKIEK